MYFTQAFYSEGVTIFSTIDKSLSRLSNSTTIYITNTTYLKDKLLQQKQ